MTAEPMSAIERIETVIPPVEIALHVTEPSPVNLPAAFWDARPALRHIQQAAHARSISADGLFGVVLARRCAATLPSVRLPPMIGADGSLNTFVALVGPSGTGKSSAVACGRDVLPLAGDGITDGLNVGSGEGLIEAYLGVPEVDGAARGRAKTQVITSVFAVLDEGEALAQQGGRKGATLLPTLRTAWSGGSLGQANASADRRRHLRDHSYRLAAVIGYQPEHAAVLLADDASGTPQRFLWLSATDPAIPDSPTPWPGPLDGQSVPAHLDLSLEVERISVALAVESEIRQRGLAQRRGQDLAHRLDSHGDLVRLKVAALLGLLDDRHDIAAADWDLAGVVMETSRAVRGEVASDARRRAAASEAASTSKAVRRQDALDDSLEAKALGRAARTIANRVHGHGPQSASDLMRAMSSKHRQHVTLYQAIDRAIDEEWIVLDSEGRYSSGSSKPS